MTYPATHELVGQKRVLVIYFPGCESSAKMSKFIRSYFMDSRRICTGPIRPEGMRGELAL